MKFFMSMLLTFLAMALFMGSIIAWNAVIEFAR